LPRLHDRAAAERSQELDQAQVADETVLEAAQPFEADDTRRPRAEAALALDPPRDRVRLEVVQPFQLEAAAEPDEGRASPLVQTEAAQLEGREGAERRGRGRFAAAVFVPRTERADHAPFVASCRLRVDELTADRSEQCLRDGRCAHRPQPAEVFRGTGE